MTTAGDLQPWKPWQKIGFRFFFLFLGFYLLNYELAMIFIDLGHYNKIVLAYGVLSQPLYWLDTHLYHMGYDPKSHDSIPSDNHFGVVFFSTAILIFILIVIVWSIIDRRKNNYHKLDYWFRVYVRYMVALIMFGYGINKLIPVQMSYPGVSDLLTPLGDQNLFSVAWNFVGASPGYEILTGLCEVTGSLLLVFRRTSVFGSLFMCTVLGNVVALNIFYNIGVKLYSSLLLVCVLYLLVPYGNRLVQFFFYGKTISLEEKHYKFERRWKKYLVIAIGFCVLLTSFIYDTYITYKTYDVVRASRMTQKIYDVTYFVTRDTLPPLLTDTLRWKRFVFNSKKSASVYNMQDKADSYDCDMDTVRQTYRIHDNADSTKWDVFHFSYPRKDLLALTGSWRGNSVNILMKEVPIDSMKLVKEKLMLIQD